MGHEAYAQEIAAPSLGNEILETIVANATKVKSSQLLRTTDFIPTEDDPTWVDRIREDPIENPPPSNGTETFSACLLVMVSTLFAFLLQQEQL